MTTQRRKTYLEDMLADDRVTAVWIYKDTNRRTEPSVSVTAVASVKGETFAVNAHMASMSHALTEAHALLSIEYDERT